MKIKILIIIIFCLLINKSFAINIGMNCASVVNQLGGLKKVDILWIENLNEKQYQYVLINLKKSNIKKFYLCGNQRNINLNSDDTITVLSERNLQIVSNNSIEILSEIFSVAGKNSRKYIMQRLNLKDFGINRNQLNQARIQGLMKLNERLEFAKEKKEETIIEKQANKEIKKPEENVKKEVTLKTSKDKTPPKIIISEKLTINSYNYQLTGVVKDKGSKNIYVEIDGEIQKAKNGRFSFERFSVVDEKVAIVAIDQWGNRSKEKIVNVQIDIKNTEIVKKLEKLNPLKIKSNILNSNKVALVIGIENYASNPKATFANSDAKAFYQYAKNIFGVKSENIKLLVDEEANLVSSLGTLNKWLPGKIKKNHTELIIFFAGHGLASTNGEQLYLLPQDGDSDLLARTAISREEIFQIVSKLNPKSVTVFFDTCYSGVSRDEETLLASARPLMIVADDQDTPENFTIFSASQLDQISSGLKEAKHGIFSYYLMKGLEGNADSNNDNKITNGELIAYLDENVSLKASELGRKQNPSLAGDPDKVLMSYR